MNGDEVVCNSEVHHAADIAQHVLYPSETEKPILQQLSSLIILSGIFMWVLIHNKSLIIAGIRFVNTGERHDLLTEEIGKVAFA